MRFDGVCWVKGIEVHFARELERDLIAAQGYRAAAEEIARRRGAMVDALTAERDAANARLALSMEAHQITISGTVASLLHMITLTREAAGCKDGENLIAVVRGLRAERDEAVDALKRIATYDYRGNQSGESQIARHALIAMRKEGGGA
jgi:hypothetical protein